MYKRRVTVRGIIFDGKKVFAQQLKLTLSKGESWWCTPGGGVEDGEDLVTALEREMIEETGVKPTIGRLLFIQQYHESKQYEQLEFFFHITNAEDYKYINLDETSHGNLEIANYNFVDPAQTNLLPADLQKIDIKAHIDQNQPVGIINNLN